MQSTDVPKQSAEQDGPRSSRLEEIYATKSETELVFTSDLRKALIKRARLAEVPLKSTIFVDSDELVASSGDEKGVKLWKIWDRKLEVTLGITRGPVSEICHSPRTNQLVGSGLDACLYLWDIATAQPVWTRETDFGLLCCGMSSECNVVITGSDYSHTVTTWDIRTGDTVLVLPKLFHGSVTSVAFAPDGHRFVAASTEDPAKIFDLRSHRTVLTLHDESVLISDTAWSRDGRKILTTSLNSKVYLYDVAAGDFRTDGDKEIFIRKPACFTCGDFSSTELGLFACGSTDGTTWILNMDKRETLFDLSSHGDSAVVDCTFSPTGNFLLTAFDDGTARIWSLVDLKQTKKYRWRLEEDPVFQACSNCDESFASSEVIGCVPAGPECSLCPFCRLQKSIGRPESRLRLADTYPAFLLVTEV